jgi:hypothetical protein
MQRVIASSFSSSVIEGEFGGGGTHCLKECNGQDSFLSYRKRIICGSNASDPSIRCKNLHTYHAFVRVETCKCQIEQYSYMQTITHSCKGNNSKHERSCLDVLIV